MNWKACVLLAALAAGSQVVAQEAQRISYAAKGKTVAAVIQDLAHAGSLELACGSELASERLVIDVEQAPLSELLERIARITGGTWVQEDGVRKLALLPAHAAAQRAEYVKARAMALQRGLQEQAKSQPELQAPIVRDVLVFAMNGEQAKSPARKLLLAALEQIGVGSFADMDILSRRVHADKPNKMQFAMELPRALIEEFIREHNQSAPSWQPKQEQPQGLRSFLILGMGGAKGSSYKIDRLGKVLLTAERYQDESIEFVLRVYDSNGLECAFSEITVEPAATKLEASSVPGGAYHPLPLSEEAKGFARLLAGRLPTQPRRLQEPAPSPTPEDVPLPDEWRTRILSPDQYEPMAWVPAELFIGLAKQKGLNLVANLPDSVIVPLSRQSVSVAPTSGQIEASASVLGIKLHSEDGWLQVQPDSLHRARTQRQDREALGRLLRSIDHEGLLRVDPLAGYARHRERPHYVNDLDRTYVGMVNRSAKLWFEAHLHRWRMLAFYDMLPQQQRQALYSERAVALAQLSGNAKEQLSRMFYQDPDRPQAKPRREDGVFELVIIADGQNDRTAWDERTEQCPNGIPTGGSFSLEQVVTPIAHAWREGEEDPNVFTAGDYAEFLLNQEAPGPNAVQRSFDWFRYGRQFDLIFRFSLAGEVSMMRILNDRDWQSEGLVRYDKLPEDFQARVKSELQRLRQERRARDLVSRQIREGNSKIPPITAR